ncbi:MAG: disulfide bond formation protein B [Candidatus Paceibacterota bacterium]|jgi:disulfide bond formation protein DsbB
MTPEKEALFAFLNYYLSLGTIIGIMLAIVWVCLLIVTLKTKKDNPVLSFIAQYALPIGFFISLGGAFFTLTYSDYLGVLPCGLCWFQRVFLYSQIFLYGLAWYKNDRKIFIYTLTLSLVGLIIAIYHHYLQMGYSELLPCPVVASTIDCAKPTLFEFGFVTLPLMAAILFVFSAIISITAIKFTKQK